MVIVFKPREKSQCGELIFFQIILDQIILDIVSDLWIDIYTDAMLSH